VIDHFGNCVTVQGIFQQINKYKKRENDIQRSVALLSDQNKRLQNYADMVSHNLRSHTGNLEALVALYEQAQDTDDRGEIFAHVKMISSSLSNTIHQLNEVVKIQAETRTQRKTVSFEKVFKNILAALDSNIKSVDATINFDFSRCPEISYIPAYLESIFQNLLTNSLKYRHPDRKPVIKTYTYQTDDHAYLFFEDNGLGFDVAKYGDNIFGLHKTFHNHPEAKGIGLFITRNQIEALGGSIKLESTINVGTKFSIMLV
jgi:light-regulated signal transduction histidine kinase (bacteriophytochrome)